MTILKLKKRITELEDASEQEPREIGLMTELGRVRQLTEQIVSLNQ
jgi:hypothetical protein